MLIVMDGMTFVTILDRESGRKRDNKRGCREIDSPREGPV